MATEGAQSIQNMCTASNNMIDVGVKVTVFISNNVECVQHAGRGIDT